MDLQDNGEDNKGMNLSLLTQDPYEVDNVLASNDLQI